ncbi:HAMP domain-containing sensor histidine kinase [Clostridium sp. KNHs214]|uniref:sensor histidine kinase n=1 Tax=Clostridium sp. KNHs214 TaxID=1540257 RepID=UPI0005507570|nr:HAMP domain-containing sensor histidine kinase [Clostridium sp. KNHs214]
MEVKKTASLSMLFLKYLGIFCVLIIVVSTLVVFGFYFALGRGFILPANYSERMIEEATEQLTQNEPFDSSLIPFTCTYTLFDENGNLERSTMSEKDLDDAKKQLSEQTEVTNSKYIHIQRTDGSNLMIEYDVFAHFANPKLHAIFPKPELIPLPLLFVLFILIAMIIAMRFSKKLKRELSPIIAATNSIKQMDLNFDITQTQIGEFNTILQSMDELKDALSRSLKEQWDLEQRKNLQLSSLAHDLKTPLTIIKGNTELLLESELPSSDQELLQYIHTSTDTIENYINLLMLTATISDEAISKKQVFCLAEFISDMQNQAEALCSLKNVSFTLKQDVLVDTFYGDVQNIKRAVLNILDNAVEHAPEKSDVSLLVLETDCGQLSFIVIDCGAGFSAAALKNAATEFYTEQAERSGKHYGLGLYIAKKVAEVHHGTLTVENKENGQGAIVSLELKNEY